MSPIYYQPLNFYMDMKKVLMMIALMAMPFAMQAQTKFHDVEANEAKGNVKTMTITMMGFTRTIEFSEDGKMKAGEITDCVYDDNGYLLSAKMNMQGQSVPVKFEWTDGRLTGQTLSVMGQEMKSNFNYDEKGVVTSASVDMGGQKMETPYTNYQFDENGNWTSRTMSVMGQEMTTTRSFTYY